MPVAITEALLKGVMYTNEPCAPLPYLFSPKFLQTDRARISVHVAAKCVPYMKVSSCLLFLFLICIFFNSISGRRHIENPRGSPCRTEKESTQGDYSQSNYPLAYALGFQRTHRARKERVDGMLPM